MFVRHFSQIGIVVHIAARIRKALFVLFGQTHGLLDGVRGLFIGTQGIDLFVFLSALISGVGRTHEIELSLELVIGEDQEDIGGLGGLLDLVEAGDDPGIHDLGIDTLIIGTHFPDLAGVDVLQRQIRVTFVPDLALKFRLGGVLVSGVVLDLQFTGMPVPVFQQKLVSGIVGNCLDRFFRDVVGNALHLSFDAAARAMLHQKESQQSHDEDADQEDCSHLLYDAVSFHHGLFPQLSGSDHRGKVFRRDCF